MGNGGVELIGQYQGRAIAGFSLTSGILCRSRFDKEVFDRSILGMLDQFWEDLMYFGCC